MQTDANDEQIVVGANVDVRALMADIEAEVERKRRAGLYPSEVIADMDLTAPDDYEDDPLASALRALNQKSVFTPDVPTGSRIKGVAPIAGAFKRVVRGSVQWYMVGILQQIQSFAAQVAQSMGLLSDRVAQLERRASDEGVEDIRATFERQLEEMLEAARRAGVSADVQARIEALEAEVQGNRLPQLERSLRGIRERLEGASPLATGPAGGTRSQKADLALDYFGFESHFRGTEDDIRAKQLVYVDLFRDSPGPVVDLGCGRGEFLELLNEGGIDASGIDRHPDMVDRCRDKGLRAEQGDALEFLRSAPPHSLGGVFSAQMIEHLEIPDVPRFFELVADALVPGGHLVVETINPESLFVFASAFYVDLGHLRPLHPLTLRFLAEQTGFMDIEVKYFSYPSDDLRPARIEGPKSLQAVLEGVNENFRRLDEIVFGPQDYALIARR